jgi:Uma2 family endonuclease
MDNPINSTNQAETIEYTTNGAKINGRKLEYYYESHPTKEDLMSETPAHSRLIRYLMNVLEENLPEDSWTTLDDIGIYQTPEYKEYPLAPDIAVFKDVALSKAELKQMRSWRRLEPNRPPPTLVFEVSSKETWDEDIEPDKKPEKYGKLGVTEYFAYDPQTPTLWRKNRKWLGKRLLGWRYDEQKNFSEIKPDNRGWLYSQVLGVWLYEDDDLLRLCDNEGNRLFTAGEAQAQRAEQARLRAEQEWLRAEQERVRANNEAQKASSAEAELKALLDKLREKGIDPDSI